MLPFDYRKDLHWHQHVTVGSMLSIQCAYRTGSTETVWCL